MRREIEPVASMKDLGPESPVTRIERSVDRRSFLKKLGITGLATATVVFGSPETAEAYSYYCCNLAHPPSSYSTCHNALCNYEWVCYHQPTNKVCTCCEMEEASPNCSIPGYIASAASCGPV